MAELERRTPFAALEQRIRAASGDRVALTPEPFLAQVGLRVGADGRARVERALGVPLPAANRVAAARMGDVLWLGPDEWLVVGPDGTERAIERSLADAVGADGAVVALSSSRTAVRLTGSGAHELLTTCCALDLDPRRFGPGHCAGTLLAKAPIVLQGIAPGAAGYRILVRPSYLDYVIDWLLDGTAGIAR